MKRTAFDERRDVQIANDTQTVTVLACTFCHTLTPVADLNTYGARCYTCYRDYCEGKRHYPSLTREQRRDMGALVKAALAGGLRASPRDHIANLEAKEAAGTASPAQRGFLAAVRSSAKVSRDD
jgi:hypothetical protein